LTGGEWLSVTQLKWRRFTGFLSVFAAPASIDETERTSIEATLIYDLQPTYNNEHKKYPP